MRAAGGSWFATWGLAVLVLALAIPTQVAAAPAPDVPPTISVASQNYVSSSAYGAEVRINLTFSATMDWIGWTTTACANAGNAGFIAKTFPNSTTYSLVGPCVIAGGPTFADHLSIYACEPNSQTCTSVIIVTTLNGTAAGTTIGFTPATASLHTLSIAAQGENKYLGSGYTIYGPQPADWVVWRWSFGPTSLSSETLKIYLGACFYATYANLYRDVPLESISLSLSASTYNDTSGKVVSYVRYCGVIQAVTAGGSFAYSNFVDFMPPKGIGLSSGDNINFGAHSSDIGFGNMTLTGTAFSGTTTAWHQWQNFSLVYNPAISAFNVTVSFLNYSLCSNPVDPVHTYTSALVVKPSPFSAMTAPWVWTGSVGCIYMYSDWGGNVTYVSGVFTVYSLPKNMASPSNTSTPGAPTSLHVVAAGSDTATLAWTAPGTSGITDYEINYGTTASMGTLIDVGGAFTSFVVSGLSSNVTYYFEVAAGTQAGWGPFSAQTSATTSSGGFFGFPIDSSSLTLYAGGLLVAGVVAYVGYYLWGRRPPAPGRMR